MDSALIKRMRELAVEHPRFGYRRIHVLLKREGFKVNAQVCLPIVETGEFEFAVEATAQTACEGRRWTGSESRETQSGMDL